MTVSWVRVRIVAAIIACASCPAAAEPVVWIGGKPNARDYLAYNATKAFEHFLEMRQHIATLNAQIAEARRAYFTASPANRAAAGERFGQLLLEKDLHIAMPRVALGNGDAAKGMEAVIKLAGGFSLPDGGIPPSASKAFGRWVSTMQFSTGNGFNGTPDPLRSAKALSEGGGATEYEAYRRLRDQAEHDEFDAERNGGIRRLMDHGHISARVMMRTDYPPGFTRRVSTLSDYVLRCTYAGRGPNFFFWKGQPPEDIMSIIAMNQTVRDDLIATLLDRSTDECPADSRQAQALASTPLKQQLTREMVAEGNAKAGSSREVSPEERRGYADRRAAAEAFRTCNAEAGAERAAAARARDLDAARAAAERQRQCAVGARTGAGR